ncbi:MAG: hypothetical protein ABIH52_02610, partial [Candidatus Aenigmatarchaeota archaeon]
MVQIDIFHALVGYHTERNLERCRPYISDGRIYIMDSSRGVLTHVPLEEGAENEIYGGVLILADGEKLSRRMKEDHVINDEEDPVFHSAVQYGEACFWDYMENTNRKDGAYIYDGDNNRIAKVWELNNRPDSLAGMNIHLDDMVPKDFTYKDSRGNEFGNKTRLAIKLPIAYPGSEAYQIKRTAYGGLGLGKVTNFGSEGLSREFFFDTDRGDHRLILGVFRDYEMH